MNFTNDHTSDLLITKVFHDIGNVVSFLNFYVELNTGDSEESPEFKELKEINKRIMLELKVLKCALLENYSSTDILSDLQCYFAFKDKDVQFQIDQLFFAPQDLKILVNVLMLLNKILPEKATIVAISDQKNLSIKCSTEEEIDFKRLNILDKFDETHDDANLYCLSQLLREVSKNILYSNTSQNELEILIK